MILQLIIVCTIMRASLVINENYSRKEVRSILKERVAMDDSVGLME